MNRLDQKGTKPHRLFERYEVEKNIAYVLIIMIKRRNGEEKGQKTRSLVTTQAWPKL